MSMMKQTVSPVVPAPPTVSSSSTTSSANASPEWQQQLVCAEISRQSFSPHHHARAAALAARSSVSNGQDPKKGITLPAGIVANGLSLPLNKGSDDTSRIRDESSGMSPTKSSFRTKETEGKEPGKSWSIIDMGGLKLKNIGIEVFRYTFLTSLFINHNNLTTISPAIVHLRNLTVLDASSNKLLALPAEIGMLTALRALFLFDNQLTILPPEMGTLYQLEMLGIEGNPLQSNLFDIIKKDGTQALIAYLRDSCPVPVPPPEREWISLDVEAPSSGEDESNTFAVLSYNVLCEKYATAQMYGYTPSWALAWNYRKEFILQEIAVTMQKCIVCKKWKWVSLMTILSQSSSSMGMRAYFGRNLVRVQCGMTNANMLMDAPRFINQILSNWLTNSLLNSIRLRYSARTSRGQKTSSIA